MLTNCALFDIIPDNIPFIGKVDEIAVAFFALERIIADVPVKIVLEKNKQERHIRGGMATRRKYKGT